MIGRTLVLKGLFSANDDLRYTNVTAFTCTDGHTLNLTIAGGATPVVDLRTVQSLTVLPAGTEYQPGNSYSENPANTGTPPVFGN